MEANYYIKINKKNYQRSRTSKKYGKPQYKPMVFESDKQKQIESKKIYENFKNDFMNINYDKNGKRKQMRTSVKKESLINKYPIKENYKLNEDITAKNVSNKIIEEFYFLDDNKSLKNIIKSNNYNNKDNFFLVSINKKNDTFQSLYQKKDFIDKYKFIYINYKDQCFKLLFPKNKLKYLQSDEETIMNELKDSIFLKQLEKLFNIDIKSNSENKEYFLTKINNNDDNKFNLNFKEIKYENNYNNKANTNILNDKNNNNIINISINKNQNNKFKPFTQINTINNYKANNNIYYFPLVGLNNVGSTCFMNATLQCLIHVPELSLYFLNEYPKDKQILNYKNVKVRTQGNLSDAYYDVVKGVDNKSKEIISYSGYNSYSPRNFKQVLGTYNTQFSRYEANDSKDLILYLLQTFHEELNYFGDKITPSNFRPPINSLRVETYNYFNINYNFTNLSKISLLFYGTYENTIKCLECKTLYYSYQKFEYISFPTYKYRNDTFDIINGFEDFESKQYLIGDNKYFCNGCKKLVNAELCSKIIDLPKYLILNIDYGKNKVNDVRNLRFDHEIDLRRFLGYYAGQKTKYRLVSICTHIGYSGQSGHYIAYCLNKQNDSWYRFDDSSCRQCNKYEINSYSPYLLFYEIIL